MRLDTYATAVGCFQCWYKHRACADCNHEPHSQFPCVECGCPIYRHGLSGEFDRQFANCVGKAPTQGQCGGYAGRECNNVVIATADGKLPRLCSSCEKSWVRDTAEGMKEVAEKFKIKPEIDLPQ